MLDNPITARLRCVRVFTFKVRPGQADAYARYLLDVVEPIDAKAHRDDAFVDVVTLTSDDPQGDWTHARVFTFRDAAQRDAMAARIAAAAADHDRSEAAREARKQHAETLRSRVAVTDCSLAL